MHESEEQKLSTKSLNPPGCCSFGGTAGVVVRPLVSFWSLRTAWSSLWLTSRRLCTFRGPGLNAPRTGRPIRSGGLGQLLVFQFWFSVFAPAYFGFVHRLTPAYASSCLPSDAT